MTTKMREKCNELLKKCLNLFPLVEIEERIEEINEILDSMEFTVMEKQVLKFCLNNVNIEALKLPIIEEIENSRENPPEISPYGYYLSGRTHYKELEIILNRKLMSRKLRN